MREISSEAVRAELTEIINNAAYTAERTIITRHGKPIAAVVSIKDLEQLQAAAKVANKK